MAERAARHKAGVKRKQEGVYHHGDLRKAMLAAAGAVLEESGVEGFTLRECARRAGVSHGAPAHHFGDARGLLSAFTAESFGQMADLMEAYQAVAGPDAYARLIANGQAYVAYALANRGRFQLMFRSDRLDLEDPALAQAGLRAYELLQHCIAGVCAQAGTGDALVMEKTALAWAMVHGFATLMLDNAAFAGYAAGDPKKAHKLVGRLIRMSRPAFEAETLP